MSDCGWLEYWHHSYGRSPTTGKSLRISRIFSKWGVSVVVWQHLKFLTQHMYDNKQQCQSILIWQHSANSCSVARWQFRCLWDSRKFCKRKCFCHYRTKFPMTTRQHSAHSCENITRQHSAHSCQIGSSPATEESLWEFRNVRVETLAPEPKQATSRSTFDFLILM